jgi:8-hydroxy-5-deazaflavin:NADPH oxidoreductase
VRVAVVGGTGPFGKALAIRLREAEVEVVVGSRDAERAAATAAELGVAGATNADAVIGADLVVLAVNAEAAIDTARTLRKSIGTTPVLSVASDLRFTRDGVVLAIDRMSLAERIQKELDGPVAAGLHSLAASNLAAAPPEEDALVCGNDPETKALVLELASRVVSGRALDAGSLASARALENLTALIINLNKRYRAHAGIRVTGIS